MKILNENSSILKLAFAASIALGLTLSSNLACKADSFQFDLFRNLAKSKATQNLLVSPYSVETAMTMAVLGASGTTYEDMQRVLDLSDSPDKIRQNVLNDLNSFNEADENTSLKIVNNLFGEKEIKFDKSYTGSMRSHFQADLTSLDFASSDSAQKINSWVKAKSDGKITSLIDKIDPSASLYLINAIYFKSTWAEQFDPSLTSEKSFHTADEQMIKVPMMVADRKKFKYFSDNKLQALRLNYKNGRYSMLFFLPDESSSLSELESQLSEETWQNWLSSFNENPGKITLPKFKIEDSMKLKSLLCTLGMSDAFDSQKADFSKMIDKSTQTELFLSEVMHKTFIDVNEEGTEAAAATAVEASSKTLDFTSKYFEMKLNRPFLFALHDQKTNKILFLGHVADPSKK